MRYVKLMTYDEAKPITAVRRGWGRDAPRIHDVIEFPVRESIYKCEHHTQVRVIGISGLIDGPTGICERILYCHPAVE